MMVRELIIAVLVFSITIAHSQTIEKLSNRIQFAELTQDKAVKAEVARLNSLINDVHPATHLQKNTQLNSNTVVPVVLITDVASAKMLYQNNSQYNSVELLIIKVEDKDDLNGVIDLSSLKSFGKLKHVYVLFTFDLCSQSTTPDSCGYLAVGKLLNGVENCNYKIVYQINVNE